MLMLHTTVGHIIQTQMYEACRGYTLRSDTTQMVTFRSKVVSNEREREREREWYWE